MRATIGGSESGGADDRWHSLWWPGAGGGAGDRGKRRKARFGSMARSDGEHHGSQRAVGGSGGPRTGCEAAVSGGDGWIESAASRRGTCFRRPSGSAALPDSQAAECEGVPAGELPERLRSADAQCVRDEQLRGGQRGVAENLPTTGKDQSERCPEPGGRVRRNADGASLGCRSGVAAETGHHQPDRIVLVDGAAGGAKRKAMARRKSAAALDRHRTLGSREEVPTYQRLSRNLVAEGTPESAAHSAERGPGSRSRLNLGVGRLTVPNIESRCNQLKLGHPPYGPFDRYGRHKRNNQ